MAMYSLNKLYPISKRPERIRLSNGNTKTDFTTFTTDDLTDAGWQVVDDKPEVNETTHKVTWDGTKWVTENLSSEELQEVKNKQLESFRTQRDKHINDIEWRIMRYHSFARQGKSQIDDITKLDKYIQDLRDCINVYDPSSTQFPSPPDELQ